MGIHGETMAKEYIIVLERKLNGHFSKFIIKV
jgi:hypothetical protein